MKRFRELVLLACLAFSASALAQVELKVYDVGPDNRDEIFSALQGLISGGVQMLPTGQIVINTTPEQHQQVETVLEAISRHEAEPTPRITLQYWVVLGHRDRVDDVNMPTQLDDVIAEIKQAHGLLSFRLLGNAAMVTDSGMTGRTNGKVYISQLAYVQGARLQANLEIGFNYEAIIDNAQFSTGQTTVQSGFPVRQSRSQSLSLNTSMEQGEFVVIGENSITDNIVGLGDVDGVIFYIVHWPTAD